jgi:P27 family predicted phage terminase small subunit
LPTALRVLRGNPSGRPINLAEPSHAALEVECPAVVVDPVARAEWARVAPGLIACGQVAVVDRATLMGYCQKYAQWQALEVEAARHPFIVRSPNDYPIPNPALGMANKAFGLMLKAAAELGITPSSRSRVVTTPRRAETAPSKWAGVLK